jgi:hypothetical protein
MIHKTLHRKLTIEQHYPHWKKGGGMEIREKPPTVSKLTDKLYNIELYEYNYL